MIARRTSSVKTEAASDFTSPQLREQEKKARADGARKGRAAIRDEQAAARAACPPQLLDRLNDRPADPMMLFGQDALRAIVREAVWRASWSAPVVVDTLARSRLALEQLDRDMRELNIPGYDALTEARGWLDDLPPQQTVKWLRCCRLYQCQRFFFDQTLGGVRQFCSGAHAKRAKRQQQKYSRTRDARGGMGDRPGPDFTPRRGRPRSKKKEKAAGVRPNLP